MTMIMFSAILFAIVFSAIFGEKVDNLRKCCKTDEVILWNTTCALSTLDRAPIEHLSKTLYDRGWVVKGTSIKWYDLKQGFCPPNYTPLEATIDEHYVKNSYLVDNVYEMMSSNFFCIELMMERNITSFSVIVLLCQQPQSSRQLPYETGMIISMPFLLVTFVVYALLPDRNLHQKALMFYVLTLLIAYILLVTINLSNEILMPWCSVIAYATIFSFMSSFFWMNVICFDIWYTFSGGRGFVGSKRSTERRRLIYYSLYALGGPLLILGLIGLMQTVLPDDSNHNPNIGVKMCFLNDGWANLWYFYLEAGILVLVNVIFFTLTALKIRKVKKETSMLNHNDSKRHSYEKDKQKDQRAIYGFNLYIKLLFAMGVNWSMEVISWAINWRTANELQYIWYVTDTFNAIYGVFIFFIFVFKKKIWSLLQKRYYNFIGKPHLAHTVTTNQTRTSHYSSTNYSTADTQLTDTNGRPSPEEMGLRTLS
ncbi:probable G-protein coupled receptor Mth-like 10 isoform X11 [Euwallacea fornicatus]|uniref:probable G-protein coupled receptor Mth-like 10 isoform X11 n=1 Tax=Euwallacea fornicatus TaxID=995702 RepID=UPI00338F8D03